MMKSKIGSREQKLGLWGVLASALILSATILSSGVSTPAKNAQTYACTDTCYANYRLCLMAGKTQAYCSNQYQMCNLQCTAGGSGAPEISTN